jgi:hypothetical protein
MEANVSTKTKRFTSHVTKDYGVFKTPRYQRPVEEYSVKKIMANIKEFGGQIQPITVDPKGYVIDGQHRIEALKRLKMPVWYVINHSLLEEEVSSYACKDANNVNNKWKTLNYSNWAIENGHEVLREAEAIAKDWSSITKNKMTVPMGLEVLNGTNKSLTVSLNDLSYKMNYKAAKETFDFAMALEPFVGFNPFSGPMIRAIKKLAVDKEGLNVKIANKIIRRKKLVMFGSVKDNYANLKELYELFE